MNGVLQNIGSSITGNVVKAILCVRDIQPILSGNTEASLMDTKEKADKLQEKLLSSTQNALNGLNMKNTEASKTFSSLTGGVNSVMAGSGYLALEVQFNPKSIYMSSEAGSQMDYTGSEPGGRAVGQMIQITQPAFTTMSFELVFDDVNVSDAFMLENMNLTMGNAISATSGLVKKKKDQQYSVQAQMDGIMSLLTRVETRQVIFFWGKMSFRGELVSVSSRYVMFNKQGNPIRGIIALSIRQGSERGDSYDERYWQEAFDKTFGAAGVNQISGKQSLLSKSTNNNILSLNI